MEAGSQPSRGQSPVPLQNQANAKPVEIGAICWLSQSLQSLHFLFPLAEYNEQVNENFTLNGSLGPPSSITEN